MTKNQRRHRCALHCFAARGSSAAAEPELGLTATLGGQCHGPEQSDEGQTAQLPKGHEPTDKRSSRQAALQAQYLKREPEQAGCQALAQGQHQRQQREDQARL